MSFDIDPKEERTQLDECIAEIKRLQARLVAAESERDAWQNACDGRGLILASYRLGKPPSEKAFKLIEKARKVLGNEVLP
jgi:hypothetical protein